MLPIGRLYVENADTPSDARSAARGDHIQPRVLRAILAILAELLRRKQHLNHRRPNACPCNGSCFRALGLEGLTEPAEPSSLRMLLVPYLLEKSLIQLHCGSKTRYSSTHRPPRMEWLGREQYGHNRDAGTTSQ